MIKLLIEEEYGYRDWYAELTEQEFEELCARWKTLRGLNCLVPVTLIIPQAVELDDGRRVNPEHTHRCHIHEEDDSYLEGCGYEIPPDDYFWMNGRKYDRDEYWPVPEANAN